MGYLIAIWQIANYPDNYSISWLYIWSLAKARNEENFAIQCKSPGTKNRLM